MTLINYCLRVFVNLQLCLQNGDMLVYFKAVAKDRVKTAADE